MLMLTQTSKLLWDEASGKISVLVLNTTFLDTKDNFSNLIIPQKTSSLLLHLVNPFWVKMIPKVL